MENARFEPQGFERSQEIPFDAAPKFIFELMNPARGNHWTRDTPRYVFGDSTNADGSMWNVGDRWLMVADYDETDLSMKTVLVIPEVEFMIEKATSSADGSGGTILTVDWRVAGLSDDGNQSAKRFFDTHWDGRIQEIRRTYERLLNSNRG